VRRITKQQLKQIIREEIELIVEEGGYLGNGYKWCPSGTKCSPQQTKTKWWKGR